MTDKKQDTITNDSVELKEEDLDQVQAGAALRTGSSTQAKPSTRRTSTGLKFDLALVAP